MSILLVQNFEKKLFFLTTTSQVMQFHKLSLSNIFNFELFFINFIKQGQRNQRYSRIFLSVMKFGKK